MCNFTTNTKLPALFKKQQINLPTGLGWVVVIFFFLAVLCLPILKIHSFLALSKPVNSKVFIVEGWMPDYCLEQIYKIYKDQSLIVKNGNQHPETTIFVTGGPLEQGTYLKEFKTFAALGSATLKKLGIPDSLIIEVPAPYVQKDRT